MPVTSLTAMRGSYGLTFAHRCMFFRSFISSTQHSLGGQRLAKILHAASQLLLLSQSPSVGPPIAWLHNLLSIPFRNTSTWQEHRLLRCSPASLSFLPPSTSQPTSSSLGALLSTWQYCKPHWFRNQGATQERWYCVGVRWLFEEFTFDQSTKECLELNIHLKAP